MLNGRESVTRSTALDARYIETVAEESSYLCSSCSFVRLTFVSISFSPHFKVSCVTTTAVYITPEWQLKEKEKKRNGEAFKKNNSEKERVLFSHSMLYFF